MRKVTSQKKNEKKNSELTRVRIGLNAIKFFSVFFGTEFFFFLNSVRTPIGRYGSGIVIFKFCTVTEYSSHEKNSVSEKISVPKKKTILWRLVMKRK